MIDPSLCSEDHYLSNQSLLTYCKIRCQSSRFATVIAIRSQLHQCEHSLLSVDPDLFIIWKFAAVIQTFGCLSYNFVSEFHSLFLSWPCYVDHTE